jgi:Ca2+-binding RTX toxin-like protein
VSGGTINNFVNGEAGNDQGFFSGGRLSTGLNMGSGNDYVEWSDGRIIAVFDMGADDHAVFIGLNNTDHLGSFLPIQGGSGNDHLEWRGTIASDVSRIQQWELFELLQGSELTFNNFQHTDARRLSRHPSVTLMLRGR